MTGAPAPFEVEPTAVVAGGRALARHPDGRVVFVDGALPGERVLVTVTAEHRGYLDAGIVEVLEPALARVTPPCPEIVRGCGACTWQHVEPEAQRVLKRDLVLDALRRVGKLDPAAAAAAMRPTVELGPWAFRTTVRAAVDDGRAGYRHARSHATVAVDGCLVAHPLLVPLIVEARYPGAEEVVLRCGSRTGERLAAPVPDRGGAVLPAGVRRDAVHEEAAGRVWRISVASFFQTRADGVDALARVVADAAGELRAGAALDLYSGVGVFAAVLAEKGWSVTAVESSAAAVADARVNLRDTDATVVLADVTRRSPARAELVVADPSRRGLGRSGVAAVTASGARRLVLVSCDAASLARDAALLRADGFTLTSLTPVDLFPHTPHVEVVSVFDRQ